MRSPRVVLFTRFPTPGAAKTRLIPALGPERAAALHRMLTERTLAELRATGLAVEVWATGAALDRFAEWLGAVALRGQGDGDLGVRLARAASPLPVILVGADAPDLGAHHVLPAARALAEAPVVIGPAEDGGYWLMGLARPLPFLFEAMPWGTPEVLPETLRRLEAHGIAPVLLERLADLDRPEDLARWPDLVA